MKPYYPVILLPEALTDAIATIGQQPDLSAFQPALPPHPGSPPKPPQHKVFLALSALVILLGAVLIFKAQLAAALLWLLLAGTAIGLLFSWQKIHYTSEIARYESQLAVRQQALEAQRQEQSRQLALPQPNAREFWRQSSFQSKADRQALLIEALAQSIPPDGSNKQNNQAPILSRFLPALRANFPGKIQTGVYLRYWDKLRGTSLYSPDFAYIDRSLNLHIAIEVDTPLQETRPNKSSTPATESLKNKPRDEIFLERGWIVVRFAAQQIQNNPRGCCKTLATLLNQIFEIPPPRQLASAPNLTPVPRWS